MAISKPVYNIDRLLHLFSVFLSYFEEPSFYGVLGFIKLLSLQYLTDKKRTNAPNQTAVNILTVWLQEKAREMVSLVRRRQLSIKKARKAANRQIKDPIGLLFFLR